MNTMKWQHSMRGAAEVTGTVDGVLKALDSRIVEDDIVRMYHSYMSTAFDRSMYNVARSDKKHFHHVYEWNMTGAPGAALWRHDLEGTTGHRVAGFHFVPSVVPVPEPTPKNTGVSASELNKIHFRKRNYKFPNKAYVFESGLRTTINPSGATHMFVPLRGKTLQPRSNKKSDIDFAKRANKRGYMWVQTPVHQDHQETMGKFTAYYLMWYEANHERIFDEQVAPRLDRSIRKVYLAGMNAVGAQTITRLASSTRSTFSMRAAADASEKAALALTKEMSKAVRKAEQYSATGGMNSE